MNKYQSYFNRLEANGSTKQEAKLNTTKRQQYNNFMNSNTLSEVYVNKETDPVHSIVSRIKTQGNFNKRRFLFKPDTPVGLGYFVEYNGFFYLSTEIVDSEIFPELIGELCNAEFPLQTDTKKEIIGYDDNKRPIPKITPVIENIPCVLTTKTYSAIENSLISLPEGTLNIKIPYNPTHVIKINYEIKMRGNTYKVTTISYENVIHEVGYIDIRLQVET